MAEAAGGGLAAVRAVQQSNENGSKCTPAPPAKPKPKAQGPRARRMGNASRSPGKGNKKKAQKMSSKSVKDEDDGAEPGEDTEKSRVKDPCMRGVSLGQLLDFYVQECGDILLEDSAQVHWQVPFCLTSRLSRRCVQLNKSRRIDISEGKARELVPNTYAVDEIAISPKCSTECMSMSELWNPMGLLIRVFVSHSWSQNFGDFIQGVYRFALTLVTENNAGLTSQEIHHRARETTLYIWAFSNNRWKAEGVKKLEKSLFFKVLQADTTWHVLMSIDQQACVFQRAWCCIEYFFATELESSVILNTPLGPLQEFQLETKADELWLVELVELLQEVDADAAQACRRTDMDMIQARLKSIDNGDSAGSAVLSGSLQAYIADMMVHHFAKVGNAEALKLALNSSADPNSQDQYYIRPLTYAAARHGAGSQVANLLLSRGADEVAMQAAADVADLFDHDHVKRERALANVKELKEPAKAFHANTLLEAELADAGRAVNKQATALASSDLKTRLDALGAISKFGPAAAPALACCLGDREVAVREEAEKVLEKLEDVSYAASNLARLLSHENADVRRRCVGWLGECGAEAEYFALDVARLLTDSDYEVSTASKQALVSLGEYAADALSDVAPLLRHKDEHVRRHSAEILRNVELESWSYVISGSPDLHVLLMDRVDEVRNLIVVALRSLEWSASKVLPPIVEKLGDKEADVRLTAQKAFESLGGLAADATPDVAKLLSNEDMEVRRAASEMMICIEWTESAKARKVAKSLKFDKLLADECEEVRKLAADALELLGEGAAEVADKVVALIADPSPAVRQQGVETLAFYGSLTAGAGPPLAKLFKHEDGAVRLCAVSQFGELGEAASKQAGALAAMLADPLEEVRAGAVAAFQKLDDHAASAAPKLAKLLKHDDAEVRMCAAKVSRLLGEAEGEPGEPYSKQIARALGEEVSGDEQEPDEADKKEEEEEEVEEEEDEKEEEDKEEDESADEPDEPDDDEEEEEDDDDDDEDESDDEDKTDAKKGAPAKPSEAPGAVEGADPSSASAVDAAAGEAPGSSKKGKEKKKKKKKGTKKTGKSEKAKEEAA